MNYRLPTLEDWEALQDYLNECRDNDEQGVLLHQELFENDYPAWVGCIVRNSREGNGDWVGPSCCSAATVTGEEQTRGSSARQILC